MTLSRRPSGLRKTNPHYNSLAHRTTWLRSDLRHHFTDNLLINTKHIIESNHSFKTYLRKSYTDLQKLINDNKKETALLEVNLKVQEEKAQLKPSKNNTRVSDTIGKYRIISVSATKSSHTIKKSIFANITLFNSLNSIYCNLAGIDFTIFDKYIELISKFVKDFMKRKIE